MIPRITSILAASIFFFAFTDKQPEKKSPLTAEDLLTSKTWKYDELRVVYRNDKVTYYKRDVFGNEYDSDSMRLSANKTGSYYSSGKVYKSEWSFLDDAKTKMKLTIFTKPAQTVYLENITVTEGYLRYVQYDAVSTNATYLASCTRTPN